MAKRTGPSSSALKKLIIDCSKLAKKEKSKFWFRLSEELAKPTRQRREVNLYKTNKFTREGEIAVIPGKVLSEGNLTKKITVAAYKFSESAKEKINQSGKAISIQQLMKENPKAKKVRIFG